MELQVSGLDAAPIRFKHLWGYYVTGFKPWTHCAQCFEHKIATAVNPTMKDGTHPLRDDLNFFYLCGVGQRDLVSTPDAWKQRATNVHLAVKPRKGSVASVGSVYGVTFTISDAEAIAIRPLADGFAGIESVKHTRCKNFQFGYQVFDVDERGVKEAREAIRSLRG